MNRPMQIIDIQRRVYERGRLRIGRKVGEKGRPERIDKFRFTSRFEESVQAAAEVFGGDVRVWDGAPTEATQWEVFTGAKELEVIVPPTAMAFSQSFEEWSGGVCNRRCDGATEYLTDSPCLCLQEMEAGGERQCKPTTRINVMLPKLGTFAMWRLETHSWNAAAELLGAAELHIAAQRAGRMSPAKLFIDQRTQRIIAKSGKNKGKPMTVHYVVPVLDPDLDLNAMLGAGGDDGMRLAIDGSVTAPITPVPEAPALPAPTIKDQLGELDSRQPERSRANAAEPLRPTGRRAKSASEVPAPEEGTPAPESEEEASEGDDPAVLARARNIAIKAGEVAEALGVPSKDRDEWRHHFLEAASAGRYSSAKSVPPEHVNVIMAGLVKTKRGEFQLVKQGRGKAATWVLVTKDGERAGPDSVEEGAAAEHEATGDQRARDDAGDWDEQRWRQSIENVAGVGPATLLKEARRRAEEMGIDKPPRLDAVTEPRLVVQLLSWLGGLVKDS